MKTLNQLAVSHRPGYCAQHYHLVRLDWINPHTGKLATTHFDKLDAQFFVSDSHHALIVVTQHASIKSGLVTQKQLLGYNAVRLATIAYTITACGSPNSKRIVSEDFIHKFKKSVWLRGWKIECRQGPLWTWRNLDDLLSSQGFAGVKGAQFIA